MTKKQVIENLLTLYKAPRDPWEKYFTNLVNSIIGCDCEWMSEATYQELLAEIRKIT